MTFDKRYYIHTGYDGALDTGDTTEADVVTLVNGLTPDRPVALHLHGALVSPASAFDTAARLLPLYLKAGVHPVFVVWGADFLSTVGNKLREVWHEGIFQSLTTHLMRHTVGHFRPAGPRGRGTAAARPNDLHAALELHKLQEMQIPFGQVRPPRDLPDVTEQDVKDLQADLQRDPVFSVEAPRVMRWLSAGGAAVRAAAAGGPVRPTLMATEDFAETDAAGPADGRKLFPHLAAPEQRQLLGLGPLTLLYHAGQVLFRVVRRFREGRDHGVYATVVEEVLREFYFTNVGAVVWGRMRRECENSFHRPEGGPTPGCLLLLEALAKRFPSPAARPALSAVAHSAGGVYACHLLAYLHERRRKGAAADLRLKNLMLLGPCCDFRLFASVLGEAASCALVRLYALRDELEAGYWELPLLYPRSLLYLVSGAFEKEEGGSAYDVPLLGMERYFSLSDVYQQPEVEQVRRFFAADPKRQVWSIVHGGPGLECDTRKHGDFCIDSQTHAPTRAMYSVLHALQAGA